MTLPPVLEDTRDLLLCIYARMMVDPGYLLAAAEVLGWMGEDSPQAVSLARLIWESMVHDTPEQESLPRALSRVINSFEGP